MAATGKVAPQTLTPSTPQSELILIDMRREGISPKMKMPKPSLANTIRSVSSRMEDRPPGWGKSRWPKI